MIMSLARFELSLLMRERPLLVMLLAVAVVVLLSCIVLAIDVGRGNDAKRSIADAERTRWVEQEEKDPHSAAHHSIYAFKPTPILSALDPGIEPFVGQAVWLEAHAQNDMLHRPKGDATPLERAGLLNPAFLLTTLAPLIAFVLAFAAIARERERGVLRMSLGVALQPRSLLLSKALVNWTAMTALLAVPSVIIAMGFALSQGVLDIDVAMRGIAWLAALAFYFLILVLVGLAVSVLCTDARIAMAALFGAWALLAIALPRTLSTVAESAMPLPSTQSIRTELQTQAPAYWGAEVSQARRDELLRQYGVTRVEDLPVNERGAQLDMAERHSHAVFDRVLGAFHDRVEAQDALFARLSFLSPAAAVQNLSQLLTGTDFSHHRSFIVQAEGYRRALVNRMNHEVATHVVAHDERHIAGRSLWESINPFMYESPRIGASAGRAGVPVTALLCWSVFAGCAFAWATRSMRP